MTEHEKEPSTLPVAADDSTIEPDGSAADSGVNSDNDVSAEPTQTKGLGTSRFWLMATILLVILAAALGGSYWVWMQWQQQMSAMATQQQVLSEELQATQAKLDRLQSENKTIDTGWHQAVDRLEALVVQSAQRLNAQANRTENRWPLEEALTLTRLASQRLQLDASASVAIGLLKSADVILSKQDQAAVLPIRRQIAADILSLQSTPAADVNGLYFQMDAIAGELKELLWVPKPTTQTAIPENSDPATGFWQSLKQVVVVTRLDVPMQAPALQSDFERWRQHTLLLLEQTQLALLARNQALFNAALLQSIDQLQQMTSQFDLSAIQDNLNAMTDAQLNPHWPDINASITALEMYLAEQANDESVDTTEEVSK